MKNNHHQDFEYDVALSFAGEDRKYVESIATHLKERGIKVFYDKYEQVELWGKDLYTHLDNVYRKKARYCVMFISKHYKEKLWANLERESAQARAFSENEEYILPARFDDTEIPGIRPTVGYISLKDFTPSEFIELILQKIGLPISKNFLPSNLSKLFKFVKARTKKEKEKIRMIAEQLFKELSMMNEDELRFIFYMCKYACPTGLLYNNVHMNSIYFERLTKMTKEQIEEIIVNLEEFGFSASIIEDKSHTWAGHGRMGKHCRLQMEVYNRSVGFVDAFPEADNNVTCILVAIIHALGERLCDGCQEKAFLRLDFSSLGKK